MPIILSHPTGNEFFRAAARGLYNAGKLQSLYTSIASFPGSLLHNIGGLQPLADIRRRGLEKAFQNITYTYPWRELGRLSAIKTRQNRLTNHETGIFSTDAVYKSFDKYVERKLSKEKRKGATAIYAYEDGAACSFKKAKELSLHTIYDLPIGYWRTMHSLLQQEKMLNPAWAVTLNGLKDSMKKLDRKEEEIQFSDIIITASSFTANSLQTYPGQLPPVKVVPYGFPQAHCKQYRNFKNSPVLKILFVGGLSQRKGLSYLFEAVNEFTRHVSLTIVGRGNVNNCEPLKRNLAKHKWIETIPHKNILTLMSEHDILIFPSLFEGFGQVITEAMSQGTPVITTERTAGPDLIDHGGNGWLVNAGSAEAIKKMLEEILLRPQLIAAAGKAAFQKAAERPWHIYETELAEAVGNA